MDNKLSELSKPYGYEYVTAGRGHVVMSRTLPPVDMREVKPLYSQEYVSALLERIAEFEWRELNSTELKELLTWHPTERSAAADPILWAAMRNKINLTRIRVAGDEAEKEQNNG